MTVHVGQHRRPEPQRNRVLLAIVAVAVAVFATAALLGFMATRSHHTAPAVRPVPSAPGTAPKAPAVVNLSACKAAMRADFDRAARGEDTSKRPAACAGVDDATLQRMAGEIAAEHIGITSP